MSSSSQGVLPEMNQAGMELGGLRRQPHDLCCRMAWKHLVVSLAVPKQVE